MHLPLGLNENLIGYWPLDEASGAVAYNYGNGGNATGTINGTGSRIKLPNGKRGINFVKASDTDEVDCGDSADYSFGNGTTDSPFSVCSWITPGTINQSRIMAKSALDNQEWLFTISGGSTLALLLMDETVSDRLDARGTTSLVGLEGTTMFVAASYDGSRATTGIKLYLNTELEDYTNSDAGSYVAMHNMAGSLTIGGYHHQTDSHWTDGPVVDNMLFDRVITQEEFKAIYKETYRR